MKGLIIKSPWIDYILTGEKVWEIRGSHTSIRGEIALIKSGTQKIYGTAEITGSILLTEKAFFEGTPNHQIKNAASLPYSKPHAWILKNPVILSKPIPYKHPQGAVIWVNLPWLKKKDLQ